MLFLLHGGHKRLADEITSPNSAAHAFYSRNDSQGHPTHVLPIQLLILPTSWTALDSARLGRESGDAQLLAHGHGWLQHLPCTPSLGATRPPLVPRELARIRLGPKSKYLEPV